MQAGRETRTSKPGEPCRRCGSRHRSWYTAAGCRWPAALWIQGCPPRGGECWALVAACGHYGTPGVTVTLHQTQEAAASSKRTIDATGCGGTCWRQHRVVPMHEEARR